MVRFSLHKLWCIIKSEGIFIICIVLTKRKHFIAHALFKMPHSSNRGILTRSHFTLTHTVIHPCQASCTFTPIQYKMQVKHLLHLKVFYYQKQSTFHTSKYISYIKIRFIHLYRIQTKLKTSMKMINIISDQDNTFLIELFKMRSL